jgi:hypothetical protein
MSDSKEVEALSREVKKLSLLLYIAIGFCFALAIAMMILWRQLIENAELLVHLQEKVIELRKTSGR